MPFSGCGEWGLLCVAVCGFLIAVASLVVKRRLQQLWLQGSVVVAGSVGVAHGLRCSVACGVLTDHEWNLLSSTGR